VRLKVSLPIAIVLLCAATTVRAAPPPALEPIEGRVVWVDFWASWCVPCRRSFPWLNSIQRKYGPAGLQIIAVNLDKDRALADGFLAEVPAEFSLRFDPSEMAAPRVVAKGADHIAERIRDIAREHGVPLVENKPLAQSLYKLAEPGDTIPVDLYRAVAEVLAYVYRLKGKHAL